MRSVDRELYYKLGLGLTEGIGGKLAKSLIEFCGSAEAVFKEKKRNLLKIPRIGPLISEALRKKETQLKIETELKFIESNNIGILFFTDESFPFRLRHCQDFPVLLYFKGSRLFNKKRIISIVGTRKPSRYGVNFCEKLVEEMSGFELLIVSGMAYGIDAVAHNSALKYQISTSGILGHGLNIMYPFQHRNLYMEMMEKGSLLTEFSSQDKFFRQNFARRNRIVAGMSDAVIVIESGIKGGSLITANIANSYNREVFALPGRYTDKLSVGCNALIKSHKAAIIESADDLIKSMMWEDDVVKSKKIEKESLLILSEEESKIMNYLNAHDDVLVETMSIEFSIPLSKLSALLLGLEMRGLIAAIPGNRYKLI